MKKINELMISAYSEYIEFQEQFREKQVMIMAIVFGMNVIGNVCWALPWDNTFTEVQNGVVNIVRPISICAIIGCGIALGFGNMGTIAKRFVQLVAGLSIAALAVDFFDVIKK